jgi:hypothetical protein
MFTDVPWLSSISMPRATKLNWRIMVDERRQLKFSNSFDTKNGMVETTCKQLHQWKQNGITVDYIRLDNAGESKLLKQRCESKDWKFGIKFEFSDKKFEFTARLRDSSH